MTFEQLRAHRRDRRLSDATGDADDGASREPSRRRGAAHVRFLRVGDAKQRHRHTRRYGASCVDDDGYSAPLNGRSDKRMPVEMRTPKTDERLAGPQRAGVGGRVERPVAQIGRRVGRGLGRFDESAERQRAHARTFWIAARAASTSENGSRSSRTS